MFPIEQADQLILDYLAQFCCAESYRLIDVENEGVYDYHGGELRDVKERCYAVWKRRRPCMNCISRRAIREGKMFLKMELSGNQVFLVCAYPIVLKNKKFSLETIWNVTDSLSTENGEIGENGLVHDLIDRMNLSVVQDIYTGLYNKSFAERAVQNAVFDWRKERPLIVVMADIDRFKEVNDLYGHIQGDLVIKRIAELLREEAEALSGIACRVGGDEFMLILRGISMEEAEQATERLKEKLAACVFGQEYRFSVTISAGAAEYTPDMQEWKLLVDKADGMMYQEKKKKRLT